LIGNISCRRIYLVAMLWACVGRRGRWMVAMDTKRLTVKFVHVGDSMVG